MSAVAGGRAYGGGGGGASAGSCQMTRSSQDTATAITFGRSTSTQLKRPVVVRTATATIAQMEGLIEDLAKIKEHRALAVSAQAACAGKQGRNRCSTYYAQPPVCTEAFVLPKGRGSTSSFDDSGSDEDYSGRSSSDRERTSVVPGLRGEIESLTEKVRFQEVLIEGLKTKQGLMEEKERRLEAKAQRLTQRVAEQQQEIHQLRATLAHERAQHEQRAKEEHDGRRRQLSESGRKESKRDPVLHSDEQDVTRKSTAMPTAEKSDSSVGDVSDVSDGSIIIFKPDGEATGATAEKGSDRGRRARERLRRKKMKKIATAREEFERKDVMLKRVVERLNADRGDNAAMTTDSKEALTQSTEGSELRRSLRERRVQIINEFVTTEEAYVNNLRTMIEIYLTPLREALLNGAEILSAEEMETLFSRDITTMFTLHATLLIELKATTAFTSALSSFVPYLKIYTQYVNNFPRAMELLTQRSARSRRFAEFIREREEIADSVRQDVHPELGKTNETLSSLLVMPIQRLPRYELLIKDILNCTPEDSPQAQELHNLLQAVQEVNTHVNESKRRQENTQKLLLIQKGLVGHNDLSVFDRIGRRYIMEGHMGARLVFGKAGSSIVSKSWRKVKAREEQPLPFSRHLLFLFDDLLLETRHIKKAGFKFKRVFLLGAISIDNYDGNDEDAERIFVLTDEEDGRVLHLKADSVHEKLEWMQAITKRIDALQEEEEEQQQRMSISF